MKDYLIVTKAADLSFLLSDESTDSVGSSVKLPLATESRSRSGGPRGTLFRGKKNIL